MKTTININQKIGQPNFGSFGASCSFEIELDQSLIERDPQLVLAQCRMLADAARAAVTAELDQQRRKAANATAPAREPGDDDLSDQAGEDLRPGDRGYERLARGRDNRPPDNRTEEQRRQGFEDRQRGYSEYVNGNAPPRNDRPVQYQDGGRQSSQRSGGGQQDRWKGGLPKTGSQLYKWYCSQQQDVQSRVNSWRQDQDMPETFRDWPDVSVADCLHSIGASQGGGRRNGYAGNLNGNGRGGY